MRLAHYHQYHSALTILGRLHRIAEILDQNEWITAKELARIEEVSTRTIMRSIDFLTDHWGWNIERGQKGYHILSKKSGFYDRIHNRTPVI